MTGDDRFVVAIVRGDYDVNETKLVNTVKARRGLRPATVEEIKARGMEAGYGSPLGARDAVVVVDELVARSPNLVAGANRAGWHVKNVNVPRDYTPDHIAEITNAREGDPCPKCGSPVKLRKGIEVGNIFKLGTDFTNAFGSMYLGEDGERHPIVMGSYGIGLGRNVACIVEAHHDEKGIAWPDEVAPYAAHLVSIGAGRDPKVLETAERLHALAKDAGREILYDDRDESPGVKFTDAELLGMPWILTVARVARRGRRRGDPPRTGERRTAPLDEIEGYLRDGFGAALPRPRAVHRMHATAGGTPDHVESADRAINRPHERWMHDRRPAARSRAFSGRNEPLIHDRLARAQIPLDPAVAALRRRRRARRGPRR